MLFYPTVLFTTACSIKQVKTFAMSVRLTPSRLSSSLPYTVVTATVIELYYLILRSFFLSFFIYAAVKIKPSEATSKIDRSVRMIIN